MVLSKLSRPVVLQSRVLRQLALQRRNASGGRAPAEYFTRTFFLGIALMISSLALIKFDQSISGPEGQPIITRLINKFHSREEVWEAKNSARTAMIEQAAKDRVLFHDAPQRNVVDYRFPEAFNSHSPNNHEAGWVGGNLDQLRAHFNKQREAHVPKALQKKEEDVKKE